MHGSSQCGSALCGCHLASLSKHGSGCVSVAVCCLHMCLAACTGSSQQVGEEHGNTEWLARAQLGHARPAAPDGERHTVWQPRLAASESCTAYTLCSAYTKFAKPSNVPASMVHSVVRTVGSQRLLRCTILCVLAKHLVCSCPGATQQVHGDKHVMTSCS